MVSPQSLPADANPSDLMDDTEDAFDSGYSTQPPEIMQTQSIQSTQSTQSAQQSVNSKARHLSNNQDYSIVYTSKQTIEEANLDSHDANGLVLHIELPAHHPMFDNGPGGDQENKHHITQAILSSTGFDIKLPMIPKELLKITNQKQAAEFVSNYTETIFAQQAAELEKTGFASLNEETGDIADNVLGQFCSDIEVSQATNQWSDLLIKPGKGDDNHTTTMRYRRGSILLKLVFINSEVANIVKLALRRWIHSVQTARLDEGVQKHLKEIKQAVKTINAKDQEGFNQVINKKKKRNVLNKHLTSLSSHLQEHAPDADRSNLAYSLLADQMELQPLHRRYVSLRLQDFNNQVRTRDIEACPLVNGALSRALALPAKSFRVQYSPSFINPLNTKIDIMLEVNHANNLLKQIADIRLCRVFGSVRDKKTNRIKSIQLIKAYNNLVQTGIPNSRTTSNNTNAGDTRSLSNRVSSTFSYALILARGASITKSKEQAPSTRPRRTGRDNAMQDVDSNAASTAPEAAASVSSSSSSSSPSPSPSSSSSSSASRIFDHRQRKKARTTSNNDESSQMLNVNDELRRMHELINQVLKSQQETQQQLQIALAANQTLAEQVKSLQQALQQREITEVQATIRTSPSVANATPATKPNDRSTSPIDSSATEPVNAPPAHDRSSDVQDLTSPAQCNSSNHDDDDCTMPSVNKRNRAPDDHHNDRTKLSRTQSHSDSGQSMSSSNPTPQKTASADPAADRSVARA
jgi:hypothetical protein